jgi:thioesterase domain-containing protein
MYETARQLAARGEAVALLAIADTIHPSIFRAEWRRRRSVPYRARKLFSRRGPAVIAYRVRRAMRRVGDAPPRYIPGLDVPIDVRAALGRERAYVPGPAPAPVVVFATEPYLRGTGSEDLGWAPLLTAGYETHIVPGSHTSMIGEPHVRHLAALLGDHLRRM